MDPEKTFYPDLSSHGWASSFHRLRDTPAPYVRDQLTTRAGEASREQIRAWDDEIPALQTEIGKLIERTVRSSDFGAILEYELPLEHRRPDVVLLIGGGIAVLEFKGKDRPEPADVDQAAGYARDLRAFHRACENRAVVPILVLTRSVDQVGMIDGVHVTDPLGVDGLTADLANSDVEPVSREEFLAIDAYRPLPSLVEAARALIESGTLPSIWRASAATDPALESLTDIAHDAARTKTRHLVLVTGLPGTGKTLVGLRLAHARFLDDLAISRRDGKPTTPAVYLSGNGPLVQVLQYQLRSAGGGGKAFVRPVKAYVATYSKAGAVPPEHVLIFDEAQRAFDATMVDSKHNSDLGQSEPELFVEFAERVPEWCVVVGLIGNGQEIHVGEEAGLHQWRAAVDGSLGEWVVHAPTEAASVLGGRVEVDDRLHLTAELRYRSTSDLHGFVDRLLNDGPVARRAADPIVEGGYHLRLTRDLDIARGYLRDRFGGDPDARFGIVASSRDRDLERFGIGNGWHATQRVNVGPWFAEGDNDPRGRSCRALRDVVTEFGCQGLELDATLLAWGTDFVRRDGAWSNLLARRYQNPGEVKDPLRLRRNAYRVLLTRAREGIVVFIPPLPILDETYVDLLAAGFRPL